MFRLTIFIPLPEKSTINEELHRTMYISKTRGIKSYPKAFPPFFSTPWKN